MNSPEIPMSPPRRRRLQRIVIRCVAGSLLAWLFAAYLLLPMVWRRYEHRHPALDGTSWITRTGNGIPGDPMNIGLVGTETELQCRDALREVVSGRRDHASKLLANRGRNGLSIGPMPMPR